MFTLPACHSVYALDVDSERRIVVAGTRAGTIEIVEVSDDCPVGEPRRMRRLVQGAPVLSVCLVGNSILASTDTAGRCFTWQLSDDTAAPTVCENNGSIVCSVLPADQNRIVGLSACGMLLWWNAESGTLLRSLAVPEPPSRLAFVRLRSWPTQNALVYPAAGGALVVCKADGSGVDIVSAHEGEFYVIVADDGAIRTIGAADGLLKTWTDMAAAANSPCRCPRGIVSGDILSDGSSRLLLVNEAGEAVICAQDGDVLRPQHRLEGNYYRAAHGPPPLVRSTLDQQRRSDRAERLIVDARERLEARPPQDIEDLLGELTDLGFEYAALAIQAQRAAQQEDVFGELYARRELAQTLPLDDPRCVSSLRCLALILERTWCLSEAQAIHARIEPTDTTASSWLARASEILAGDGWIAESVHPIPLLIEVATVVGRPFTGFWLVERAEQIPFSEGTLTGEALAGKYEQVKAEKGSADLPIAKARKIWWLSERRARQVDVVTLENPGGSAGPQARPAVWILSEGLQSALVPLVLFDAGRASADGSWREHNSQVRSIYEQLSEQSVASEWPRRLHQTLNLAVQRLRNHAQWRWR
ncbi:MAG: hypothetical protein QUV05_20110 [Phycisphaerae bacterium]|nr:hypothetical protein [Phycisphaerae bacterium]